MEASQKRFYEAVRPILEAGRTVSFSATGSSMRPFIRPGEEVKVRKADCYRRGDVVLAVVDSGNQIVLHYVAETDGDSFTLMGAANLQKREICRKQDILGCLVSPGVGRRKILLWHRLLPARPLLLKLL